MYKGTKTGAVNNLYTVFQKTGTRFVFAITLSIVIRF